MSDSPDRIPLTIGTLHPLPDAPEVPAWRPRTCPHCRCDAGAHVISCPFGQAQVTALPHLGPDPRWPLLGVLGVLLTAGLTVYFVGRMLGWW